MKISDICRLAFLNLYRRLSRSLLTVTGVVIGTACIVVMIAIGTTNLNEFNEMFENTSLTEIEVMSSGYSESGFGQTELNEAAVTAFANIDKVKSVIPQKRITMYAEIDNYYAEYLPVIAIPEEMIAEMAELEDGRYFTSQNNMPELIMGIGAARYFIQSEDDYRSRDYEGPSLDWLAIQPELFLGSMYNMENPDIPSSRKYYANIVGIIENESEEYNNTDIYISMETAKKIIQENYKLASKTNLDTDTYDTVYVYAESMEDVADILKTIKSYGFEAYSQTEWIEEMKGQQQSQQGQLAAIGFISLLVSAIGIANTMMTSILERRREIGVMKVIGVAIGKIRMIFLIEAALIGLLGGILGVTLGHLLAYLMNTGSSTDAILGMQFATGVKIVIPIWLDLAAIGMAITVGMIAGIFPARRATKMSAIEAIRAV